MDKKEIQQILTRDIAEILFGTKKLNPDLKPEDFADIAVNSLLQSLASMFYMFCKTDDGSIKVIKKDAGNALAKYIKILADNFENGEGKNG